MAAATQNQTRKEVYLRVVDATVEGARAEFEKLGHDASSLAALEKLRERWQGYLVATEEELEREENGEAVDEEDEAGGEDAVEESGEPVEEVKAYAVEDDGDDEVEKIPQNDGAAGTSSEDDVGGDEDEPGSKRRKVEDEVDAAEEDSDIADPDDDTVGPEPEADDFILAQYDKVSRKKDKWKVTLKDCVVHIAGRELLFQTVSCDLLW